MIGVEQGLSDAHDCLVLASTSDFIDSWLFSLAAEVSAPFLLVGSYVCVSRPETARELVEVFEGSLKGLIEGWLRLPEALADFDSRDSSGFSKLQRVVPR